MRSVLASRIAWAAGLWLPVLLLLSMPAGAQDAVTVAPGVFKKLMENERMRVLEATFKPGAKAPTHSLSEHLFYMLSGGSLIIRPAGRTAYEMPIKVGESLYLPAQTREVENEGSETVRVLIVEVKGAGAARGARRGGKRTRGKRR